MSCKPPEKQTAYNQTVEIEIESPTITSGDSTSITASVNEALTPTVGAKVTFTGVGNCGTISPTTATTDAGLQMNLDHPGEAKVKFTGNSPYSTCTESITATAKSSGTAIVTVTPRKIVRQIAAPGASGDAPTIELTPDVKLPITDGYSATYTLNSIGADIDSIRVITSAKSTITSGDNATPVPDANNPNAFEIQETAGANFDSEVLTITSDSKKMGWLTLTVRFKNVGGRTAQVTFVDPTTKKSTVPGPG